ncbi:vacuolar protein sorting-associated protein 37B [Protopterus annectens]|uniref:vacuolar protein sorting-associated protein 37B n=1 Tax=Protopterus annectens TaxID=7888 RepID=UPI001CF9E099|nr:vacuolar protein sorting-associated protein 37B [Protopterus annectens]
MAVDISKFGTLPMCQLNELLEDDEKLNGMVKEMGEVQAVQLNKEMTLAGNRSLAEQNLLQQPRLEELKEQLNHKYQELQMVFEQYQMKKTRIDNQSSSASLEMLLALLQAEGAKIEEETENMAERFLDGEISLDSFIDEYHTKRKLAHVRRVKIEKLQEMVLKGARLPPVHVQSISVQAEKTPTSQVSYPTESTSTPTPLPRRIPPPPPSATGALPTPFTAAAATSSAGPGSSSVPYPVTPCPPLPPRVGNAPIPFTTPYTSQYPPALPQRPAARMPPQPGFIFQ